MADRTNISWCDATWSPWYGCTQVSMGEQGACEGCYARFMWETRFGRVVFGGPGRGEGTRDVRSDPAWKEPLKWDRQQASAVQDWRNRYPLGSGVPKPQHFVFPSMCDPFDNHPDLSEPRRRFFDLIRATPNLTWLLLTKRPGNIVKLFREALGFSASADVECVWPANAAIGCTVVNQQEADRDIPKLLRAKAALNPAFAFLSMEPLLGPVDLGRIKAPKVTPEDDADDWYFDALTPGGYYFYDAGSGYTEGGDGPDREAIDWVITGGETDQGLHRARPSHHEWFQSLRDQCAAAGVPFHHKQHGEWKPICWMADGESDDLYHPAPRRDPEAIRRCKVEHTVMNRDGSLHPDAADPETYHERHGSMLMFKVGAKRSGRLLDGVLHDARPEVRS